MARRVHAAVLQAFDDLVASGVPIAEAGRKVAISEKTARRRAGVSGTHPSPRSAARGDHRRLSEDLALITPCLAHRLEAAAAYLRRHA